MSQRLKSLVNNLLGFIGDWRICSTKPRGRFFFDDIKPFIPAGATVLDVGANRGQWSLELLEQLPGIESVHCFEPMPFEYQGLIDNTSHDARIHCHSYAISSTPGEALLYQGVHSTTNSLAKEWDNQGSIEAQLETLDDLCQQLNIGVINLLKIDTEGHDLEVLKGARMLLRSHSIDLILTEVSFISSSRLPLFDDIRSYLETLGYQLFGLYDQQPAWDGSPSLIYANACFIRPTV